MTARFHTVVLIYSRMDSMIIDDDKVAFDVLINSLEGLLTLEPKSDIKAKLS